MKDISSAERRALRARAHPLNPVVIIGNGGLTPGVVAEVERSLKAHELIKIRVGGVDHAERELVCEAICAQTGAHLVQHIGKVLVVYRERPAEKKQTVPRKPRKKAVTPGISVRKPAARRVSTYEAGGAGFDASRRPRRARS